MADGFIVRRGGKAEEVLRTATPDINFVSKTDTQIVVTFKNNDAGEAEIYYGLTAPLTDTVTLATGATSSNVTFSGLAANTQFTVSAYALVTDPTTKKIKSEVVSTNITTDALIYTAATGGTTEEYNLDSKRYKSHTFTSNGTFEVTTAGNGDRNQVDYLIIAGGAGGGARRASGGGAGGFRTTVGTQGGLGTLDSKVTVTAQSYSVVVGAGSTGSNDQNATGSNGSNSSALGITSTGGGAGASQNDNAGNGGSGGGSNNVTGSRVAGTGTANQGFNGGLGKTTETFNGAGGGGAGQVGGNGDFGSNIAGSGGNGLANLLRTGSNETRAGGGGGGALDGTTAGTGGTGGGGNGQNNAAGSNATANTGSGGGAGGLGPSPTFNVNYAGGNGGSGIVIIRYEIAPTV
jgi:hypothetical protein